MRQDTIHVRVIVPITTRGFRRPDMLRALESPGVVVSRAEIDTERRGGFVHDDELGDGPHGAADRYRLMTAILVASAAWEDVGIAAMSAAANMSP